jgi:hypothetical protein
MSQTSKGVDDGLGLTNSQTSKGLTMGLGQLGPKHKKKNEPTWAVIRSVYRT